MIVMFLTFYIEVI